LLASDVVGVVVVFFFGGGVGVDGRGRAACGREAWENECCDASLTSSVAKLEEHGRVGGVVDEAAVRSIER